jgi:hypothetical protein
MTTKRAFGQAIALWEATRQTATDDDFDTLENAERVILDHRPTSLAEAANMLEVVMEQRGDGRSDGLDLRAIERIVSLLRKGSVGLHAVQTPGSVVDFSPNPG